mmetsp:Transcript_30262/g.34494  ORF Transcript_30262/g.34494 Transcript_30262/m.34494 type:complete len:957 (-) Transcript_30262:37-2907(-)
MLRRRLTAIIAFAAKILIYHALGVVAVENVTLKAFLFNENKSRITKVMNDQCNSAVQVLPRPFIISASNKDALSDFSNSACNVEKETRGVWYQITPSDNLVIMVTVSLQEFDAVLSVYSGSCGSLSCISGTTGSATSNEIVTFAAKADRTYYMLVSGENTIDDFGDFQLAIEDLSSSNDACDKAQTVVPTSLPFSTSSNNIGAFPQFVSSSCNVERNTRGVWYLITPPSNSILVLTVSQQKFDAVLSVYSGTCGDLTCIDGSQGSRFAQQVVTLEARAETTYSVLVSGDNSFNEAGLFQLDIGSLEAPVNEECNAATNIDTSPFSTNGNSSAAFPSFSNVDCNILERSRGLWYTYFAVKDEIVEALVYDQEFETILSVFTGTCEELTCFQSTSSSNSVDRTLSWTALGGTRYYILITGNEFNDQGSFRLKLTTIERPSNDACDDAASISDPPSFAFGNSDGALPGFTNAACEVSNRGLWYEYNPQKSSIYRAFISNNDFPGRLSILSGSCDDLKCQVSRIPPRFSVASITFPALIGSPIKLLVSGDEFTDSGIFLLNLESLQRPLNDECTGAKVLELSSSTLDTTTPAFPGFSSTSCGIGSSSRSLWYSFNSSPEKTTMVVTISNYDWALDLSLFSGSCDDLTCEKVVSATFDTDSNTFTPFDITWMADEGKDYYLAVSGVDSFYDNGPFKLEFNGETPTPAPAPSGFCFPMKATVEVLGKGVTLMKNLEIGDKVKVSDENFETIYSFGHKEENIIAEYIVLTTQSTQLEISMNHMVFLADGRAIPSSLVKIGNEIVLSSNKSEVVTTIGKTHLPGAFAPFTPSGIIIVNGVKVSTYVAFQESSNINIGVISTGVSFQWVANTFEYPHRVWCAWQFSTCQREKYVNGISTWVYYSNQFAAWLFSQHWTITFVIWSILMVYFLLISALQVSLTVQGLITIAFMFKLRKESRREIKKN